MPKAPAAAVRRMLRGCSSQAGKEEEEEGARHEAGKGGVQDKGLCGKEIEQTSADGTGDAQQEAPQGTTGGRKTKASLSSGFFAAGACTNKGRAQNL